MTHSRPLANANKKQAKNTDNAEHEKAMPKNLETREQGSLTNGNEEAVFQGHKQPRPPHRGHHAAADKTANEQGHAMYKQENPQESVCREESTSNEEKYDSATTIQ